MQIPLPFLRRLLSLALVLGSGYAAQAQVIPQPVPLAGSSFNADIVANGTGQTSAANSASDADGGSNYFPSVDYTTSGAAAFFHPTMGLPYGQSFLSTGTPNVRFNLAGYASNNDLRLTGTGSGTLTLAAPVSTQTLYVLATGGGVGTATANNLRLTVNFADGSSQVFSRIVPDWYSTIVQPYHTTTAYILNTRINSGNSFDVVSSNPRLFQLVLPLDQTQATSSAVTSIQVDKLVSAGIIHVMAVSAGGAAYAPVGLSLPAASTPTATSATGQDVVANGTGQSSPNNSATDVDGAGYFLVSADYTKSQTTTPTSVTQGLPLNGVVPSLSVPGLTYQLQPYSGVNALQIRGAASGTLPFASSPTASEVYVLANTVLTTGSTASGTMTVNFSDGTSHAFPVTYYNWFTTSGVAAPTYVGYSPNARVQGYATVGGTANTTNNITNYINTSGVAANTPNLFEFKLALNASEYGKTITGVTVAGTSSTILSLLAASVNPGTPTTCALSSGTLSVAANSATACASTSLNLVLTGVPVQLGYTYQWQYQKVSGSSWANIPTTASGTEPVTTNATSATCTLSNQTEATKYRCIVTCANGTSATSGELTVGQTNIINCYCNPAQPTSNSSCGTNGTITAVNINGGSGLAQTSLTCPAAPYNSFGIVATTTATGTLTQGTAYTLTVNVSNASRVAAWFDANQNGTFEASEYISPGTTTGSGTVTLSIPASLTTSAALGSTKLRIRSESNTASVLSNAGNACATTAYGETLDYTLTVAAGTACTGTPPATTATSTATSVCSSTSFTLDATGITPGTTGLSYQWQSSPAGANTFANLGSAQTSSVYAVSSQTAATDYRVVVTCTASSQSTTSSTVAVAQNPFLNCYCTPTYATGGANDIVTRVQLGTLDNSTTGNVSPYYHDYSAQQTGASPTLAVPDLFAGGTATITLSFGTDGSQYSGVWIDFNHNGIFDTTEFFSLGTNAGGSGTVNIPIAVPAAALLGQTKLRIRGGDDSQPTSAQACGASSSSYGEAEDYTVNVVAPVACTGTPPATTATSTTASACSGTGFTLNATGVAPGTTGLSYQWQSSPAGAGTFANLGSAQASASYAVSSITASTDYQVIVTCTASGQSTTSSIVSVAKGYLNCYCTVVSTGSGEYIKSVTLPGTPGFTNTTNASSANGTGDFTGNSALTTTLNQGATYLNGVSVTVHANNTGSQGGMWIDYDHSGTFDASEYIALGTSNLINTDVTLTTTLTVPSLALTGQTRVRVRWRNGTIAATDACTTGSTTWYGETEDYLITIAAPTTCSAPPSSVTATASTANACANSAFTLSTNSIPTTLGGYSFQWQSSPAGAGTFTNIGGATTQSYTVNSQTAATDYQLVVSCQYGGTPVTSNVVSVGQNPFDQCYCTTSSTNGCGTYGSIANVTIGTLNNSSGCAASTYTVYPASTATTNLNANSSATLTLSIANASAGYRYGVWIDFNQNGTFDAAEFVASSSTSTVASPTASIAIPASALAGPTRLRVRTKAGITSYGDFAATDACAVQYDGETEDYTVTIVAPTACSGTPAAPVASASTAAVCGGTSFTLSYASAGNITGLSYQWQSSPAGTNAFANIGGATATPYTVASQTAATDYRVVVTCTNGGVSTPSNVLSVGQNSFANCYCTPTGGVCTNEYIRGVQVNTLSNTGTGCTGAGYADYTANTALTTTLAAGGTYPMTLSLRINSNPAAAGVWIDYDHSGTFDASEFTQIYSNTAAASNLDVSGTANIVVPAGALTGTTRMRVRSANSSVPLSASTACPPNPYYGEIEDYLITISSTIPDLTVSTTTTIPAGTYNNVTVTGTGNGTLTGATVVNGNFYVLPGGTLNTACQPLTGPGTFALAANATLTICDPAGISLSGATGAIQTATRKFSIAGTYAYNGSAAQVTGPGLPAQVRNLTVNNTAGLTLSQAVATRRLLTLSSGNLLGGQNLTLRSDADSTALVAVGTSGGSVTGAATVQRYISPATNAGLGYRHFAAPVTNTTVADLTTGSFSPNVSQGAAYNASATPGLVTPFPNVFGYSEARQATSPATGYSVFDRGWLAPTSTSDPLTSGKGYTVNLAAGQMVDFVGTLGNGNVPLALTRGTTTDAGWNLLGNPYPSTLNWDNVTIPAGMDAAVYVYQSTSQYAGSYTSYTNGLGTGSRSATIGMGQGFFVRVSPGTTSTTFTLTNAARSTDFGSGGTFQRGNDPRARLRLALENAGATLSDAAYVYFEAGATAGVDAHYDAVKLANPTGLGLSAVAAGTELAINGLPLVNVATIVPLTVTVPQGGTYTLRADELLNLPAGPVYLHDALTGQQINLLQQASYTFSTTGAARLAGRFTLGFAPAASPLAAQAGLTAASVSVYPNPAHTSITVLLPAVPGAKEAQLTLYNSLGQRVREQIALLSATGAQAVMSVKDLAAGVYTLRLQVAGQSMVARRVMVE